jgi:membrane protein required for colicin V production
MNALDIIVLAVIALSALFAFARGFVKEALSIAAWVGAALVALYGLPHARPFAKQFISSPMLADVAAGAALFIVSLIILSIITSMIAGTVKNSALSAVDRALGLVFGIVRGVLLVCVGFIALSWAIRGSDEPTWMRDARTRPFLASGAEFLKSFIPAETRERGAAAAADAQKTVEQAQEAEKLMRALSTPTPAAAQPGAKPAPTASTGYKSQERKQMDQLFQQAQ